MLGSCRRTNHAAAIACPGLPGSHQQLSEIASIFNTYVELGGRLLAVITEVPVAAPRTVNARGRTRSDAIRCGGPVSTQRTTQASAVKRGIERLRGQLGSDDVFNRK